MYNATVDWSAAHSIAIWVYLGIRIPNDLKFLSWCSRARKICNGTSNSIQPATDLKSIAITYPSNIRNFGYRPMVPSGGSCCISKLNGEILPLAKAPCPPPLSISRGATNSWNLIKKTKLFFTAFLIQPMYVVFGDAFELLLALVGSHQFLLTCSSLSTVWRFRRCNGSLALLRTLTMTSASVPMYPYLLRA